MNRRKFSASISHMASRPGFGGVLCAFLFAAAAVLADEISDNKIVLAAVNVPTPGLSCDDAAAQASVTFKVVGAPFTVQRYSVFIDGNGLPESALDEAWPSIAVQQGFHPGRNLVEFILYGADNQSLDRKQTLLIGAAANSSDVAPAQIDCSGAIAQDDESAWPALALNGTGQTVSEPSSDQDGNQSADQSAPVIESTSAYFDGPIYTYYPAPVFFGPVFSAGFFAAPRIIYGPRPPLFYDSRRGPHYRPGSAISNAHPGRDGAAPPRSYGDTSNNQDAFGQTGEIHPGAAHRGTFSTYSPPAYRGSTAGSGKAGKAGVSPFDDDGDRHNAAASSSAPRGYDAGPSYGNAAGGAQQNLPQQLPPPSRQLTPPQQLPLPSQRFGIPRPQAAPRPAENRSQSAPR